jgi:hypothetical protein
LITTPQTPLYPSALMLLLLKIKAKAKLGSLCPPLRELGAESEPTRSIPAGAGHINWMTGNRFSPLITLSA